MICHLIDASQCHVVFSAFVPQDYHFACCVKQNEIGKHLYENFPFFLIKLLFNDRRIALVSLLFVLICQRVGSNSPGPPIRRLIEEVASLDLNRDSTLLLSVGGNDVFPKNARHGPTETTVRDLDHLLETAKSKVNRCVVMGILPRKYRTNEA